MPFRFAALVGNIKPAAYMKIIEILVDHFLELIIFNHI